MTEPVDGKIRIRCSGCGKRVKFPAIPGGTFRCPICRTILVAPLDLSEMTDRSAAGDEASKSAVTPLPEPRPTPRPFAPPPSDAPAPAPQPRKAQEPAIRRINAFYFRETQRIGELCEEIMREAAGDEDRILRLRQIRHAKAVHMREYVDTVFKELDEEIAGLRDGLASETESAKARLAELSAERHAAALYVKTMFEMRALEPAAKSGSSARPETRGSEAAPPSRP